MVYYWCNDNLKESSINWYDDWWGDQRMISIDEKKMIKDRIGHSLYNIWYVTIGQVK